MKSDVRNQLTSADLTPGSPCSPPQLLFDMLSNRYADKQQNVNDV